LINSADLIASLLTLILDAFDRLALLQFLAVSTIAPNVKLLRNHYVEYYPKLITGSHNECVIFPDRVRENIRTA
jgi:hypothetical protein